MTTDDLLANIRQAISRYYASRAERDDNAAIAAGRDACAYFEQLDQKLSKGKGTLLPDAWGVRVLEVTRVEFRCRHCGNQDCPNVTEDATWSKCPATYRMKGEKV